MKQRRTKKHHKAETKKKKSKPPDIHKGKKIRKLKLSLSRISLESTAVPRPVTKAKKQEHHKVRKISKVHQSSHCVMCDKSFENGDRGYQRFNLMKMVNDDMDVAEVMQVRMLTFSPYQSISIPFLPSLPPCLLFPLSLLPSLSPKVNRNKKNNKID